MCVCFVLCSVFTAMYISRMISWLLAYCIVRIVYEHKSLHIPDDWRYLGCLRTCGHCVLTQILTCAWWWPCLAEICLWVYIKERTVYAKNYNLSNFIYKFYFMYIKWTPRGICTPTGSRCEKKKRAVDTKEKSATVGGRHLYIMGLTNSPRR
jgi:hypothetical protein